MSIAIPVGYDERRVDALAGLAQAEATLAERIEAKAKAALGFESIETRLVSGDSTVTPPNWLFAAECGFPGALGSVAGGAGDAAVEFEEAVVSLIRAAVPARAKPEHIEM